MGTAPVGSADPAGVAPVVAKSSGHATLEGRLAVVAEAPGVVEGKGWLYPFCNGMATKGARFCVTQGHQVV